MEMARKPRKGTGAALDKLLHEDFYAQVMKKKKPTERRCLSCYDEMLSHHYGQRICHKCNTKNKRRANRVQGMPTL